MPIIFLKMKFWELRANKVIKEWELEGECHTIKKISHNDKEYLLCGTENLEVKQLIRLLTKLHIPYLIFF